MKCQSVSHNSVSISLDDGETPSSRAVAQEVRLALRVCGYSVWEKISIEMYIGNRGGIIFARPAE